MSKTVEQITAAAQQASEADRQTILRFALFSAGLPIDDTPEPSLVGLDELVQSAESIKDAESGHATPYDDVSAEMRALLSKNGA